MVGVGEATGGSETQPRVAAIEEIKHLVIGMNPRNIHETFHKLYLSAFIRVTPAMAGIEMACWDILGKSLGVPVHRLLGGKVRERVRVYANGWYSGERTPEGFAEKASEVVAKGYTALKFDPFGDAHMQLFRKETREVKALVGAVRAAVGPDVDILIEAHDRFSTYAAIEIGNWLEEYEVTYTVLHDPQMRGMDLYRVLGLPATFLIDREGNLQWMRYGPVGETDSEFRNALEDALR